MISANKSNAPSAHVLKRSRTMGVERLSPAEFRVSPAEPGKVKRIVRFHFDEVEGVFVDCYAEDSKIGCKANTCGRYCSHVERAIMYLLEITKESKDEQQ